MNQEQSATILLALMALALLGAWWGWRRRKSSYSDWAQHLTWWDGENPDGDVREGLYVGTSEAGLPLQRVAVGPLSYRGKASLGTDSSGLVLHVRGSRPLLIPFSGGVRAGRATWTIDKSVEPDGLLMVQWSLGPHLVESYFRLVDSDVQNVVNAINVAAGAE